jgi:hypothetical protein
MTNEPTTPPDPKRRKFPLLEQAEAANRELTMRYRVYSQRVKDGKMTQAAMDDGVAVMRAIRDTMRLFAEHEDDIRALLEFKRQRARENAETAAEIEALRKHPAVGLVLEHFPDAEVGAPRRPPSQDDFTPELPPFDHELEAADA